jgi:hypothetical protein
MPEQEILGGPIQDISGAAEMLQPNSADDESWFEPQTEL